MRTDSLRISEEARASAKKFITENYGKDYVPAKQRYFKQKNKFGFFIEKFCIDSKILEHKYQKQQGNYTLISIDDVLLISAKAKKHYVQHIAQVFSEYINLEPKDNILIVGLGNENISADSLGSKVVSKVIVSRNMIDGVPKVSAISPGVMGTTGIESADIINGVVDLVKPNKVVVIDSLCASSVSRLGRSIQFTDTGITPGGGVGNARKSIQTKDGMKVVVIGVPLVVYATTFMQDYIDMDKLEKDIKDLFVRENISLKILSKMYGIIASKKSQDVSGSVVTQKDIEMRVEVLSHLISSAINLSIFGVNSIDEL